MQVVNFKVYSLICPIDKESVRYIGYTKLTLEKRLNGHLEDESKTHKCNWIKSLKEKCLIPIIELIEDEIPDKPLALKTEIAYIKLFKSFGAKLVNATNGGEGGEMLPEIKAKISNTLTGVKHSNERRANTSLALKGKKKSLQHCANISKNQTGKKKKPMSELARKNISIAGKGRPLTTDEARKNMSDAQKGEKSYWYGKKQSQETKDKRSNSHKGKIHSEEHRKKTSEGTKAAWKRMKLEGIMRDSPMKGKKHSEESKQKNRLSQLGKKQSQETKDKRVTTRKATEERKKQERLTMVF